MSKEIQYYLDKIELLQTQLVKKELEVNKYKEELFRANSVIEKLIQDINTELKLALKVQKTLSPTEIPSIPGFEISSKFIPGTEKGGDYFDFFDLKEKMKFGIFVSSCSGYSLSSILMSVFIKSTSERMNSASKPDEFLNSILKEIKEGMSPNDSLSLFYAVVDRKNYEMLYGSIGSIHCAHIVDGLDPIYLKGHAEYKKNSDYKIEIRKLSLNSKDRICIYTQGILTPSIETEQALDLDKVLKKKSAFSTVHELRNEVLFQSEKLAGTANPDCDQIFIALEVKDKILKLAKT
jgi:sigma-B regulation protein RsbU (phosphoserine phosphatase)